MVLPVANQPSYTTINLNKFPGEMKLPGATVAQQAENVGYQDIFRDIQAMRNQEYAQEVKRGEFVPEFSSWTKEFGDYSNSSKFIILVILLIVGYTGYKFFRKS